MIKLVIFGIAALILWVVWRNWSKRSRVAFIENYPYARFLDKRLAARRPELSEAQRQAVFLGLQDYFRLCQHAGKRMVAMPSQAVDDAWHEFILFTRQYDKFCRAAFGRFLHHTPAEAMSAPTQASEGIRRAWRLACAHEKIDPQKPDRLPRLFALDATLLLAGGFVYQLDCMAAQKTGLGDAYCASHIGCGGSGGCSGDSGSSDGGDGCGGGCGGGD
jgi:hypothetical protein